MAKHFNFVLVSALEDQSVVTTQTVWAKWHWFSHCSIARRYVVTSVLIFKAKNNFVGLKFKKKKKMSIFMIISLDFY